MSEDHPCRFRSAVVHSDHPCVRAHNKPFGARHTEPAQLRVAGGPTRVYVAGNSCMHSSLSSGSGAAVTCKGGHGLFRAEPPALTSGRLLGPGLVRAPGQERGAGLSVGCLGAGGPGQTAEPRPGEVVHDRPVSGLVVSELAVEAGYPDSRNLIVADVRPAAGMTT